jgi:hypothetical protein
MLLGPGPPMLCQAQDFVASAPFLYFADHEPELSRLVRRDRADFLHQFHALATPEMRAQLPDPADVATLEQTKLDLSERERHPGADWRVRWSSEDPRYGGFGAPHVEGDESWHLPGQSAIVVRPERKGETDG